LRLRKDFGVSNSKLKSLTECGGGRAQGGKKRSNRRARRKARGSLAQEGIGVRPRSNGEERKSQLEEELAAEKTDTWSISANGNNLAVKKKDWDKRKWKREEDYT